MLPQIRSTDWIEKKRGGFNSGVMVFTPNEKAWQDMKALVKGMAAPTNRMEMGGAEQDFIGQFFSRRNPKVQCIT